MSFRRVRSSKLALLRQPIRMLTLVGIALLVCDQAMAQTHRAGSYRGRRAAAQKPEVMRWRVVPKKRAVSKKDETKLPQYPDDSVSQAEYQTEVIAADMGEVYFDEPVYIESSGIQSSGCDDLPPYSDLYSPLRECVDPRCTRRRSTGAYNRLVGRAEYLLWWTSGMDAPPLATTSPTGTAQDQAGVLDQLGTSVLFGDDAYNDRSRSGGRYTIEIWNDDCRSQGWEFSYLSLANETTRFSASDADRSILARPFFNQATNAQDARLIAFPGVVDGSLNIDLSTDFQSAEALYRWTAQGSTCGRMEYLLGYRFAELDDGISIADSTLSLAGATAGTTFDLVDRFDSVNTFHGGQFGIACHWQPNRCWSIDLLGKLALGATQREADVTGRTLVSTAAANTENTGGLLTQGTNIGSYSSDNFATITEFGVTINRHFNQNLTANFGYTFLYWNDVSRAGDQMDLNVNPSQIPPGTLVGPARPAFDFRSTDFWAQGLRFGLELKF